MRNKSQIKFGETFGILIIMYFVIIFGIKFYESYLKDNIEEIKEEDRKLRENEKFTYFSKLNYLKYSVSGINKYGFDLYSLEAYKNYTDIYEDDVEEKLGYANATIYIIDINNSNYNLSVNRTINLYENTLDDFKSKIIYREIHPIRDMINERNYLGILQVDFYS